MLSQRILYYKGLSIVHMILPPNKGGKDRPYVNYWKGMTNLEMGQYLKLEITKVDKEIDPPERDRYVATFSQFDLFKLRMQLSELQDILLDEDTFYEEEHIEKGLMLRVKKELRSYSLNFISSTGKSQIVIQPRVIYNRSQDEYKPAVSIFINSDASLTTMTIDRFMAFIDIILNFDLNMESKALVNLHLSQRLVYNNIISKHNSAIEYS